MKKVFYLIPLCCLCGNLLSAKEYHVSPQESDANDGSVSAPLKTINVAAQKALPGDVVTVHGGTYREWVNPLNGGESNDNRIIYQVAKGEKAELKGSELIKSWTKEKKGKGVVYLNDVSLYEITSIDQVLHPDTIRSVRDPEGTQRVWFAVVDADHGSYIVDNNIFLSNRSVWESSDGGAYLNNLFCGSFMRNNDERYTPYHLNHSTEVKGLIVITNGDHRYYNNIFVAGTEADAPYGLCVYDPAEWPIQAEDNILFFCIVLCRMCKWIYKVVNY